MFHLQIKFLCSVFLVISPAMKQELDKQIKNLSTFIWMFSNYTTSQYPLLTQSFGTPHKSAPKWSTIISSTFIITIEASTGSTKFLIPDPKHSEVIGSLSTDFTGLWIRGLVHNQQPIRRFLQSVSASSHPSFQQKENFILKSLTFMVVKPSQMWTNTSSSSCISRQTNLKKAFRQPPVIQKDQTSSQWGVNSEICLLFIILAWNQCAYHRVVDTISSQTLGGGKILLDNPNLILNLSL